MMDFDNIISPYRTSMLKYERGRVQTDGEYKYLFETIKNHMHRAGHVIQIPIYPLKLSKHQSNLGNAPPQFYNSPENCYPSDGPWRL